MLNYIEVVDGYPRIYVIQDHENWVYNNYKQEINIYRKRQINRYHHPSAVP